MGLRRAAPRRGAPEAFIHVPPLQPGPGDPEVLIPAVLRAVLREARPGAPCVSLTLPQAAPEGRTLFRPARCCPNQLCRPRAAS